MKDTSSKPASVNQYISEFPEVTQNALNQVRTCILDIVPKAVETIKYGIPTYVYRNKNLVHFGGYKKHIGFYPSPKVLIHFKQQIVGFASSKGAVQFPLDRPIPLELIAEMTLFRKAQVDEG